ncbi:Blue copper protein, partial [Mucuna pruriens]
MARNVGLNVMGCSIFAMVFIICATEPTDYKVGDSFGWNVPTNESFYKDWASTKRFFVGDSLVFNWSGEHSLGIRTEAIYYDSCNTSAFGPTFRSNGSVSLFRYILPQTGPRYFICTISNHCARGQKLSINVESQPPGSAAPTLSFGTLYAFLSSLAVYFFTIIG